MSPTTSTDPSTTPVSSSCSSSSSSPTSRVSPVAVVTGAARGIGAAIAARLVGDGYRVVRLDVMGASEVFDDTNDPGARPSPVDGDAHIAPVLQCDVSDPIAVDRMADLVRREFGPVSVLVNNAGAWSFGALEDVTPEEFLRTLAVNVGGTFHCTQAFGRSMLERGHGSIINIVSIAAEAANPRVGAYSASKAGVVALTRQIGLEWGPRGVRANAVGPGFVPTPGTGTVYDDSSVRAVRSSVVPLRRLGEPDDIANVVSFLASDQSSYVNGQVIYVDGGFSEALMTLVPRPHGVPTS